MILICLLKFVKYYKRRHGQCAKEYEKDVNVGSGDCGNHFGIIRVHVPHKYICFCCIF